MTPNPTGHPIPVPLVAPNPGHPYLDPPVAPNHGNPIPAPAIKPIDEARDQAEETIRAQRA